MLAYVETVTLTQYSYTHTDFLTESHRSLSKRVRSHRSLTDGISRVCLFVGEPAWRRTLLRPLSQLKGVQFPGLFGRAY